MKRVPVYLSQEDLEHFRNLMVDRRREFPFVKENKKLDNLFDRISEQLMTFEEYENGVKKLEE